MKKFLIICGIVAFFYVFVNISLTIAVAGVKLHTVLR